MKTRVIRARYEVLAALSQRVLPTEDAVNKVSVLLRSYFGSAYEATEDGRKQIIRQHPLPEDFSGDRLPALIEEQRQFALDDFMERTGQPIKKVPERLRLKKADLPRDVKLRSGETDETNRLSVAWIIFNLGTLFVDADAPADEDGEEEPFEAPAALRLAASGE